jgi:hypothetical protein
MSDTYTTPTRLIAELGETVRPWSDKAQDHVVIVITLPLRLRMARVGPDDPTGGYFDAEGTLPW